MKHIKKFDLVAETKSFFNITPFSPILPWIDRNVTMVDDVSSERDRPDFSMYPYQVDILKQWEDLDIRKHVTVVMCEQMGKTSTFVYGILYRLTYRPGSILVCYPATDKAIETNNTKFIPLMKHIPRIQARASEAASHQKRPHKDVQCCHVLAGEWHKDHKQIM